MLNNNKQCYTHISVGELESISIKMSTIALISFVFSEKLPNPLVHYDRPWPLFTLMILWNLC